MIALGLLVVAALPADVTAYADRYEQCIRWIGEAIEAPQRAREIEQEVKRLGCDRLDRDEAELRRRYRHRSDVIVRLDAVRTLD